MTSFEEWLKTYKPNFALMDTRLSMDLENAFLAGHKAGVESVLERMPSEDESEAECAAFEEDKTRSQDNPAWPEWVASDADYWSECYRWLRDQLSKGEK